MKKINKKFIIGIIAVVVIAAGGIGYAMYNSNNSDAEKVKSEQASVTKEIEKTDPSQYYEEDREAINKLVEDAKANINKAKKVSEIDKIKADFEEALKKYDTMSAYSKNINTALAEYLDKENYYEPEQSDIDAIVKKYEDAIKTSTKKSDVNDLEKNAKADLDLVLTKEKKDEKVADGEIESTKASTSNISGANTNAVKGSSSAAQSSKPSGSTSSGSTSSGGSSSGGSSSGGSSGGSTTQPSQPAHTHLAVGNICGWKDTVDEVEAVFDAKSAYWSNLLNSGQCTRDEYYANCPIGWSGYQCSCGMWTGNYKYR